MKALNSDIPKLEKYQLAWAGLLGGGDCDTVGHSKCWLTYRAFDGEVPFEDWVRQIEPVAFPAGGTEETERWAVSISTATFYLAVIQNDRRRMEQSAMRVMTANLELWPGMLLNWCRVRAILAQDALLRGEKQECRALIEETFKVWKQVMGGFDPLRHPVRFVEAAEDLRVLHTLMMMTRQMGLVAEHMINIPWLKVYEKNINKCGQPWVRCIHHLRKKNEEVLAAQDVTPAYRVELGRMVPPGGTVIELGVAQGNFSAELLRQHGHIGKLYAIDKWDDERHPESEMQEAVKNLADERATVCRLSFDKAATAPPFTKGAFDLIYVDGYAHTGQENGATLEQWWPKVRHGGVLAGHDYDPAWPLTVGAVNAFAAQHRLVINTIREKPFNSWWVRKPVITSQ